MPRYGGALFFLIIEKPTNGQAKEDKNVSAHRILRYGCHRMSRRELGERLFVRCAVHFIFSKESGFSNPRYGTCVYVSVDITWRHLNDGNNISSV